MDEQNAKKHSVLFQNWCDRTSWSGIVDWYYAANFFLRIIWMIILFVTTFLSLIQVGALIFSAVYDDQLSITIYYEKSKHGIPFPPITICNRNDFNKTKFSEENIDETTLFYILNKIEFNRTYSRNIADDEFERLFAQTKSKAEVFDTNYANVTISEMHKKFGFSCNSTVVLCGDINSKTKLHGDHCCEHQLQDEECFNIVLKRSNGENFVQETSGYNNGVYLILNPNLKDYSPTNRDGLHKMSTGFELYFHYDKGYKATGANPILLAPSMHSVVALTPLRTEIRRTEGFFNFLLPILPCNRTANYQVINIEQYSKSACEYDCSQLCIIAACNCSSFDSVKFPYRTCTYNEIRPCTKLLQAVNNCDIATENKCKAACLEPCKYDSFTSQTSTTSYPDDSKIPFLISWLELSIGVNITVDELKTLSLVEVYFANSDYRVTERKFSTTIDGLLSDIGGALGLWTGGNMITILQAIVYLMHFLIVKAIVLYRVTQF